jgi:hypothetical protein
MSYVLYPRDLGSLPTGTPVGQFQTATVPSHIFFLYGKVFMETLTEISENTQVYEINYLSPITQCFD